MSVPGTMKSDIIARVRAGQSVRQVARDLDLPLSTTYHHSRNFCNHQSRIEMDTIGQDQLGYLLGLFVGDGSLIRDRLRGEFLVKMALDRRRDLTLFNSLRLRLKGPERKPTSGLSAV